MTYTDPSTSTQDSLKARAQNEYDDARTRLHEGAQRLKTEAAPTLMNSVTGELERRKDGLSAELRSLAETLRHASDEQQSGKDSLQASGLIGHGAQLVEDLSRGLEGRSVNEIGQSLSGYARGNPAVFIGGCLVAGLALGRLLTASSSAATSSSYSGASSTGTPYAGASSTGMGSTGAASSYNTNPNTNTATTPSSYATDATPSTATPSTTPAAPYVSPKREDDDVGL
ncbi:hypothetical protein [Falsirhodobacter sp. 20TX0035]|uniref:hypothetical protein n=1 Tax=Falsirhodobacter sp. 20TX0035 TaxID=3022019 RepID=UPI00232EE1E3|nr:hypothetical protein [Falsirhodobacter sp. 20TX0035]MDB6453004.1 hypothetical protein [Falsirhodobacter sp. 20TX0035]